MSRVIRVQSSQSPAAFLTELCALSHLWPQLPSRMHAPQACGLEVSGKPDAFTLAFIKTTREWAHPICVGTVRSTAEGSLIEARVRLSRSYFMAQGAFWAGCLLWVLATGQTMGALGILALVVLSGIFAGVLLSFAGPAHEAEADALVALITAAAHRTTGAAAG
jgi:hypothetical protein